MRCPVCALDNLQIKNNNYYCLSCKIFIGQVENSDSISTSSLPLKTLVTHKKKDSPLKPLITNTIFLTCFILIIALFYFLYKSMTGYVDIANACIISFDVMSSKEKSRLTEAITYLRESDSNGYQTLCQYIDTIMEDQCLSADIYVETKEAMVGASQPGCYIKGSKTMYFLGHLDFSFSKRKNAVLLKKYAAFSKDFWTTNR